MGAGFQRLLARAGWAVQFITPLGQPATNLNASRDWGKSYGMLRRLGVTFATDHDLGIDLVGASPRTGDQREDAHGVLACGQDCGFRCVGCVLLVTEDEHREHHAGGGRPHAVTLLGDGASDVAAAGVLESDHGRLHWRPSRAIMS